MNIWNIWSYGHIVIPLAMWRLPSAWQILRSWVAAAEIMLPTAGSVTNLEDVGRTNKLVEHQMHMQCRKWHLGIHAIWGKRSATHDDVIDCIDCVWIYKSIDFESAAPSEILQGKAKRTQRSWKQPAMWVWLPRQVNDQRGPLKERLVKFGDFARFNCLILYSFCRLEAKSFFT